MTGRLLRVAVAEHDLVSAPGEIAGEIGGDGALADAALGIGNHYDWHVDSSMEAT